MLFEFWSWLTRNSVSSLLFVASLWRALMNSFLASRLEFNDSISSSHSVILDFILTFLISLKKQTIQQNFKLFKFSQHTLVSSCSVFRDSVFISLIVLTYLFSKFFSLSVNSSSSSSTSSTRDSVDYKKWDKTFRQICQSLFTLLKLALRLFSSLSWFLVLFWWTFWPFLLEHCPCNNANDQHLIAFPCKNDFQYEGDFFFTFLNWIWLLTFLLRSSRTQILVSSCSMACPASVNKLCLSASSCLKLSTWTCQIKMFTFIWTEIYEESGGEFILTPIRKGRLWDVFIILS